MQTWLRSGSNCRVRRQRPGKFFRPSHAARRKPKKTGDFRLAQRLHCMAERTRKDPRPMDNSLLVSLSQQLAAYRAMDVIANNLANVSTPGFKREAAKFEEFVAHMRPAEEQKGPQSV